MNNIKLIKGIILVLKDNLESSKEIKWIRSEQHLSLHGLRSVQISKDAQKHEANLSLCGQYFATLQNESIGLPFERLQGSALEEGKACKSCLKMYQQLKDKNAVHSLFFALLIQVLL